jgi:hypothetical protein
MISRLRLASVVAFIVVGSSGLVAAVVIAGSHVRTPAPTDRVHRFYTHGPTPEYQSDLAASAP